MHESYDDDHDDNYDDDQYNHDYPPNAHNWYYKFDIGPDTPISKWLDNIINDAWSMLNIPGFSTQKFPVSSWHPNTANKKFQYLGSNYHGSPIWKTQYFIVDKIHNEYRLHIQNHAKHFVQQPVYYNGLFDILN